MSKKKKTIRLDSIRIKRDGLKTLNINNELNPDEVDDLRRELESELGASVVFVYTEIDKEESE